MPRRVRVPVPDELFRPTVVHASDAGPSVAGESVPAAAELAVVETPVAAPRTASGRVRHEEKMTVYVTSEELLDLEHARLTLRRDHGMAVDRGRLVREAVAMVLADFDRNGAESALAQRLTDG